MTAEFIFLSVSVYKGMSRHLSKNSSAMLGRQYNFSIHCGNRLKDKYNYVAIYSKMINEVCKLQ